jgi:site-specific DNA recombinase
MALPVDIYTRISRVGGREHMISREEQERDARAFAKRRGLTIGETFHDEDKSGGTLDRPGLQAALERVREGRSGGIVVAYLSRLTRETSQGLALIEDVRAAGGEVYAPNLSDHTTADGRMLNTIQLAIDAGMRERASETIARARENAIARGVPVTNRDAVGYRRNAARHYEPDEAAPVIRELFERRAQGASQAELARFLEDRGVRTSQGSRTWSREAVAVLLRSRVYLGELRSGPYVNPVAHEPLVSEPLWLAAQSPPPRPRTRSDSYLLTSILRCKSCGYVMQGTRTSRGKRIYRCKRRHAGGICPEPARIDADVVEERVLSEIRSRLMVPNLETPQAVDLAPLEAAYEAAGRRLAQAETPAAQDALGERWLAVVKERRAARDEAGRALGEAQAANPGRRGFWDAYRVFDDEKTTLDEKRAAIAGVFRYVAVARDKTIHWPPGDDDPPVEVLSRRGYNRQAGLNPLPDYPADEVEA